ncbi:MAG: hypothetical protein JRN15_02935, partial [Nitrososphaerota archaeon]|nr:hypothetical protein [Nitrososphaerota archaeon]
MIIQAGVGLANFPKLLFHYFRMVGLVFKWMMDRVASQNPSTTLKSHLSTVVRPNLSPAAPLNGMNTLLYCFAAM